MSQPLKIRRKGDPDPIRHRPGVFARLRGDVTGLQAEVARLSRGLSRLEAAREEGSPPARCEGGAELYRRVCQALHVEEDSMPIAELADKVLARCQLYDRLADPEAYDVADPDALANVVLTALGTVRSQARQLEQLADELIGVRQELADMVDAEHGTAPEIVLERVQRRAKAMQHLIECYEPEQLRAVAAGLHGFCAESHSPGWGVADMLDIASTISEEEQDGNDD